MERIQRLATRLVKGMRQLLYEGRLCRLNMFLLDRRRFRGDLILAYNIFHGRLDLPRAEFFEAPSDFVSILDFVWIPCSLPFFDSHAPSIFILHGLRRLTVPLYLNNRLDLINKKQTIIDKFSLLIAT